MNIEKKSDQPNQEEIQKAEESKTNSRIEHTSMFPEHDPFSSEKYNGITLNMDSEHIEGPGGSLPIRDLLFPDPVEAGRLFNKVVFDKDEKDEVLTRGCKEARDYLDKREFPEGTDEDVYGLIFLRALRKSIGFAPLKITIKA